VKEFSDVLLYDAAQGTVHSLYWVRKRDGELRAKLRWAAQSHLERTGRPPDPGPPGMAALLKKRYLLRRPVHPLGGGYVFTGDGRPRPEKNWDELLARFEGR
jgi:hypothetical protein